MKYGGFISWCNHFNIFLSSAFSDISSVKYPSWTDGDECLVSYILAVHGYFNEKVHWQIKCCSTGLILSTLRWHIFFLSFKQIDELVESFERRRNYVAAFLSAFGTYVNNCLNSCFVKILHYSVKITLLMERLKSLLFSCVLEYDAEAFSEISFLMEVNHFFFILTSMFISYSFIIMFPTPSWPCQIRTHGVFVA
jgi:hypothetical protein